MGRPYEERVEYELNKLRSDKNAQNQFFGRAIALQNSQNTYDATYANEKMEFACDVLCRCNWCHTNCADCKLTEANRKALEDIKHGKRRGEKANKKRKNSKRHLEVVGTYRVSLDINHHTGVFKLIFTPGRKPVKPVKEWDHTRRREH